MFTIYILYTPFIYNIKYDLHVISLFLYYCIVFISVIYMGRPHHINRRQDIALLKKEKFVDMWKGRV